MAKYTLTLITEGREESSPVASGVTVLEALQGFDEFDFDAPCGGKGTCGKCKVLVDGTLSPPEEQERKLLSPVSLGKGVRLACLCKIEGDVNVTPLFSSSGARIVTHHASFSGSLNPTIRLQRIELPEPTLEDQRSDEFRLREALSAGDGRDSSSLPLPLIRSLSLRMREGAGLTLGYVGKRLCALFAGDAGPGYGIAIDIGTTTVVAYLLDLSSGRTVKAVSGLNLQKAWGGDVISRVQAAIDYGPEPLRKAVVNQLTRMIFRLIEENEIDWRELRGVSVAGNTVMMHLFAGIDPRHIAVSPFIPGFCGLRVEGSGDTFPRLPTEVPVLLLPSISGFIGADISAGILSCKIREKAKPTLLIDIGTNGEIVLGNRERIVACSTAAGPAFEGANISRGVGGIPGAVNRISLDGEKLSFTTIGDLPPIGICGSGIIDLVSILVALGIIDEGGRLLPPDELPGELPDHLRKMVTEEGFRLSADKEGQDLLFTPKDVREVQLAKASVAAGIDVLVETYGISMEEVDAIYLAGGFGSFIDTGSAVGIGLLPEVLIDHIHPAGNTAGAGAAEVLLSTEAFDKLQELAAGVEYLELSASLRFQELYVERMFFPSTL